MARKAAEPPENKARIKLTRGGRDMAKKAAEPPERKARIKFTRGRAKHGEESN